MRPYSIAVAADWSFTNRNTRERIEGLFAWELYTSLPSQVTAMGTPA
jgi:hypothetical protein